MIAKLSDMGVPVWLLRIVMAFLRDKTIVVRCKGATSSSRSLPGGRPQGTLLGLLPFIGLISDVGFKDQQNNVGDLITCRRNLRAANQIHLKLVDDLTVAESLILEDNVKPVPLSDRPQPDPYHSRTGHSLIPEKSKVLRQIKEIQDYARSNEMKLNLKKTKFMLFNKCKNIDFMPSLTLEGMEIELVEEMKILGVVLSSDLKFSKNSEYIVERGFSRIWMLRRLKNLGASVHQLVDVYIKQVRIVLEFAVSVWHSSLTLSDKVDIERVQRAALQVIFGQDYLFACVSAALLTLDERRQLLCTKFSFKAVKNTKHSKFVKVNSKARRTRQTISPFCPVVSKTTRFEKSPLSYLTKL